MDKDQLSVDVTRHAGVGMDVVLQSLEGKVSDVIVAWAVSNHGEVRDEAHEDNG